MEKKLLLAAICLAAFTLVGCKDRNSFRPDTPDPLCPVLINGVVEEVDCDTLTQCESDTACPAGTYCTGIAVCGSWCDSDARCEELFAAGYTCSSRGRCIPPTGPTPPPPPPLPDTCQTYDENFEVIEVDCDTLEACDPADDQCSEGSFCLNGEYNFCARQCDFGNDDTCPEFAFCNDRGLCEAEDLPTLCDTYDPETFEPIQVDCDTLVACTTDDQCPEDTFCLNGEYNYCAFQCTPENNTCPEFIDSEGNVAGQMECNSGRCENPTELPVCELVQKAVNIVFIVDRSGSMDDEFGNTTRYNAVATALTAVSAAFPAEEALFSTYLYWRDDAYVPNFSAGEGDGTPIDGCPVTSSVAYGGDVGALFSSESPGGWTPTAETVRFVTAAQDGIEQPGEGPTVFILATDGLPNGCWDGRQAVDLTNSIAAVSEAYTADYTTYILGLGDDVAASPTFLQEMADAGQGVDGAEYWVATDPSGLIQSLTTIVEEAILPITCEPLDPPEDPDFGVEPPPEVELPELPSFPAPVPPPPPPVVQ